MKVCWHEDCVMHINKYRQLCFTLTNCDIQSLILGSVSLYLPPSLVLIASEFCSHTFPVYRSSCMRGMSGNWKTSATFQNSTEKLTSHTVFHGQHCHSIAFSTNSKNLLAYTSGFTVDISWPC